MVEYLSGQTTVSYLKIVVRLLFHHPIGQMTFLLSHISRLSIIYCFGTTTTSISKTLVAFLSESYLLPYSIYNLVSPGIIALNLK